MIHVDTREKPLICNLVEKSLPGLLNKIKLDSGDFVLFDPDGCTLGIERKTAIDLLGSVADRRLFNQLERMEAEYTDRILVVEGHLMFDKRDGKVSTVGRDTGWNHGAIQMILFGAQRRFDTQVLYTDSPAATADLLRVLHNRLEKGCVKEILNGRRHEADEEAHEIPGAIA